MGTGGVGKTSLAIATLHHPASISKYPRRFFVSCETTSSEFDLVAAIGSTIGLEPSTITLYAILRTLSSHDLALLVLDNVETVWEPMGSRNGIEELLSKLNDISNLSLIVSLLFRR